MKSGNKFFVSLSILLNTSAIVSAVCIANKVPYAMLTPYISIGEFSNSSKYNGKEYRQAN